MTFEVSDKVRRATANMIAHEYNYIWYCRRYEGRPKAAVDRLFRRDARRLERKWIEAIKGGDA
jgi:hypothetical protein